jgi:hypothetical protein
MRAMRTRLRLGPELPQQLERAGVARLLGEDRAELRDRLFPLPGGKVGAAEVDAERRRPWPEDDRALQGLERAPMVASRQEDPSKLRQGGSTVRACLEGLPVEPLGLGRAARRGRDPSPPEDGLRAGRGLGARGRG